MPYLIDVSEFQGDVDFHRVRQAEYVGVWAKATEGVGWKDPRFDRNAREARAVGLRFGAYHFARPDRNEAVPEADYFCSVIGKCHRRDLRPVLDLEVETKLNPRLIEMWAHRFCTRVYHRIGTLPLFYSYTSYIQALDVRVPIGAGL